MTLNLRVFESEEAAKDASAKLTAAGYREHIVVLASEAAGKEEEAVRASVAGGLLSDRMVGTSVRSLKQGRSLVSARAPFGRGQEVLNIMDDAGAIASEAAGHIANNPAPLSEGFGLPVLTPFVPMTGLVSSSWSFSSMFGLPLLSKSAAPLSSMIGFKPVLQRKKNWTSSMGLPLLSRNAAPLSSIFGMTTVYSPKRPWQWSWGLPLLTSNPAPLSSLFGIPTLTRKR